MFHSGLIQFDELQLIQTTLKKDWIEGNFFYSQLRSQVLYYPSRASGRKNVLRKLLRIPYRRLKAGFSVC